MGIKANDLISRSTLITNDVSVVLWLLAEEGPHDI